MAERPQRLIVEGDPSEMKITHQKCREIQAPIVSSLIYGFAREIGHEKAIEIVKNVISEDAVASGKKSAQEYSGNTIAELSKIVKEKSLKAIKYLIPLKMNFLHCYSNYLFL